MSKVEEVFLEHFPTGIESSKVNERYLLFMMKSVWNTAIREAADNADADFNMLGPPKQEGTEFVYDVEVYVLKQSILKLLIE